MHWRRKQVMVGVYAYRFGIEDLGVSQDELLQLIGLTGGQWMARLELDFPALDGLTRHVQPNERLREDAREFRDVPQAVLRGQVLAYLDSLRRRGGVR